MLGESLASFDICLKYRAGKLNANTDGLSRQRVQQEVESNDISSCMVQVLSCTAVPLELQKTVLDAAHDSITAACQVVDVTYVTALFPFYSREQSIMD